MKETLVSGSGAALGIALLIFALTYSASTPRVLDIAPEVSIPVGDLSAIHANTSVSSPLFSQEFVPTGYDIFDNLLLSNRTKSNISSTTTPSAASVSKALRTKQASSTPTLSPKTALTANTVALRGAAVNILCTSKDGSVRSVSGSGVIIDSRGIILTVAHVAQMYLLANYPTPGNVSCIVRTGSPAVSAYTAELVYISSDWITKYPNTLVAAAPTGTGANDFALIAITGSTTNTPLPTDFPAVPLSTETPKAGDAVGVGSYGAQYLTSNEIRTGLYQTLVYGLILKDYTFTTNKVEALSIKAGAAAQPGSSGGGVVNTRGEYTGLITNSSNTGDFSTRELRAITPFHIRNSFKDDMGTELDSYIANSSKQELIAAFKTKSAKLGALVINAIK
ncbi:serine protease [Patescibacteria group bacterium]|nr:serine protease [Patescibacteria group bacterium]MBU1754792.1 serine protease [Patescibacteria group bacterium]